MEFKRVATKYGYEFTELKVAKLATGAETLEDANALMVGYPEDERCLMITAANMIYMNIKNEK